MFWITKKLHKSDTKYKQYKVLHAWIHIYTCKANTPALKCKNNVICSYYTSIEHVLVKS